MISFLKLCLLSRFERAQGDGGPESIDEFLGSMLDSIVENIDEPENLRYRRGVTAHERASQDSRDKKAADAAAESRAHLFESCASDIGFQVLFLSSVFRDFLFPV